ncbi:diaminopimelate decarboxylase [Anaerobacterium chartisolvens]|uniref:Diaminopimelate decarboxylase n=1 Tax=Anaerobacterium chartisolvens TaxID=1297424 RepID=A0A369B432_9FIRM|nr:diaminopimelate decarboxylase [Anaerobacterium chartisolvens]RCX16320.1 diaminopimelate decarboxylase [Anaerobacterium chartisolvens]
MLKESIKEQILIKVKGEAFKKHPFFYLYDLSNITSKLELLNTYAADNISLYYAMKANSNFEILELIKKHPNVKGVEIASSGELDIALSHFKPLQVIYTGPGKRPYELELSLNNKIRFLSAESLTEVYRISELIEIHNLGKADILIRINPNYDIKNSLKKMGGISSKMGIDEDRIIDVLEEVLKFKNINVAGVHVFAASGIIEHKDLLEYVEYIFRLVSKIESICNREFKIIDFGGGFGIDYSCANKKFNVEAFFNHLKMLVDNFQYNNKELVLELGRFITAEAGYYISQIIDIKESKGKKHIIIGGGINHIRLIRKHPINIIPMGNRLIYDKQPAVKDEFVEIEGPLCFGEDKIDEDIFIKEANIGDLVVISHVGAYGYNVASLEFLCHPKPNEYVCCNA